MLDLAYIMTNRHVAAGYQTRIHASLVQGREVGVGYQYAYAAGLLDCCI